MLRLLVLAAAQEYADDHEVTGSAGFLGTTTATYGLKDGSQKKGCTNWAAIELTHGYQDPGDGTSPQECAHACAGTENCKGFELRHVNNNEWTCDLWKGDCDLDPPGTEKEIKGQWFEVERNEGMPDLTPLLYVILAAAVLALLYMLLRNIDCKKAPKITKRGVEKRTVEAKKETPRSPTSGSVVPLLPMAPVSPVIAPAAPMMAMQQPIAMQQPMVAGPAVGGFGYQGIGGMGGVAAPVGGYGFRGF